MISPRPAADEAPWVAPLLAWYAAHKRELPWRRASSAYEIWLSEIMLQQTRVDTVLGYFARFTARFPTVQVLAEADLQQVLKLWEGLGYYSRARNLHRAAREVVHEHGGRFPDSLEGLRSLPGIGPYTAAAVGSIAFGLAEPVVDGNVLRAFARVFGIEEDIRRDAVRRALADRLRPLMPAGPGGVPGLSPADFNQAIMELGAVLCTPRSPRCDACPISRHCAARREGRVDELPHKSKRPRVPEHEIGVGLIWRGEELLVARRRQEAMLGGLWEFPGGKRAEGEGLEDCVAREILEETGLRAEVGEPLITVKHAYSHFRIRLTAFDCRLPEAERDGRERPLASDELRWVSVEGLEALPFPTANKKVIEALRARRYRQS